MSYSIGQILPNDSLGQCQLERLLREEGILKDRNLDYSCGMFNDGELIATGSCFGNTLRCLAVSSDYRGEGLMAGIASHLIEYEFNRGFSHLFVYTKPDAAPLFESLGFSTIATIPGKVVFLENTRNGFYSFCRALAPADMNCRLTQAAIVMNANPFTLGHRYLVEKAASENDLVHIFVLSEDKSVFPSKERYKMVAEGCSDLKNVIIHETGDYLISNATFPGYFFKEDLDVIKAHAGLDGAVFSRIAHAAGISRRYVGTEHASETTSIYNSVLSEILPNAGIELIIVPRLEISGETVSASSVRKLIHDGKINVVRNYVPDSTWNFLNSEIGMNVIRQIQSTSYKK